MDAHNRGGGGPQGCHPIVTTCLEGLIEPHVDFECALNIVAVFHFASSFFEFTPRGVWISEDEARWVGALRALHATPLQPISITSVVLGFGDFRDFGSAHNDGS